MSVEFAIQVGGKYDEVLAAARWAESRGLAAVALPDHYLTARDDAAAAASPAPDALIQLAGLARETNAIQLVVLVSPITFRHPAVLLKMAVTIDCMSGGRFALGVGTGWLEREHEVFGLPYPSLDERYAALEEALGYLRAGLSPINPGFDGERFRLEAFPLAPKPVGPVPLIVGGTGKRRTPRLAGTYADEYNCYPAPPAAFSERVRVARRAAAGAGRDPDSVRISSAGQVVAAPTRTEYDARLDELALEAGMTRDDLETHYQRRSTPRGTYGEVRAQLAGLMEAGMTRFYLQLGRFDRDRAEELIANIAP